jgi:hypothetical protein
VISDRSTPICDLVTNTLARARYFVPVPAGSLPRGMQAPVRFREMTMARHEKPWTPEADETLRKAVLAGRSLRTMCQQLGRTEAAVRARAYVLGLSLRLAKTKRRGVAKWG